MVSRWRERGNGLNAGDATDIKSFSRAVPGALLSASLVAGIGSSRIPEQLSFHATLGSRIKLLRQGRETVSRTARIDDNGAGRY